MKYLSLVFILLTTGVETLLAQSDLYRSSGGIVHFISKAPLETIEARSNSLKGVIKPLDHTYAFSMDISSFAGFNSPLQETHFNENYLESEVFPTATFTGKIIEDVDWESTEVQQVRAKGTLTIHGVSQERIIKSNLVVDENSVRIQSNFSIPLEEHDISIPKIVAQKISEVIEVTVEITLSKESPAN